MLLNIRFIFNFNIYYQLFSSKTPANTACFYLHGCIPIAYTILYDFVFIGPNFFFFF